MPVGSYLVELTNGGKMVVFANEYEEVSRETLFYTNGKIVVSITSKQIENIKKTGIQKEETL